MRAHIYIRMSVPFFFFSFPFSRSDLFFLTKTLMSYAKFKKIKISTMFSLLLRFVLIFHSFFEDTKTTFDAVAGVAGGTGAAAKDDLARSANPIRNGRD